MNSASLADLTDFTPLHDNFVGIDSDGCVFDTMDAKQRLYFHPLICQFWHLEKIEPQVRAVAEFVNLTSKLRGRNRFTNLLATFELLHQWSETRDSEVTLPALDALRSYCNSGVPLGNPSLEQAVGRNPDPELQRLLAWSLAVNEAIDHHMEPMPPFPSALRALKLIAAGSDAIVVSQTPASALLREWLHHRMTHLVSAIAGQEAGAKEEQLKAATQSKYRPGRVLMIGDAPGDLVAADRAGTLFYPIVPGFEEESWQRFCDDSYERFLAGTYAGTYAETLRQEFLNAMPDTPPFMAKTDI